MEINKLFLKKNIYWSPELHYVETDVILQP